MERKNQEATIESLSLTYILMSPKVAGTVEIYMNISLVKVRTLKKSHPNKVTALKLTFGQEQQNIKRSPTALTFPLLKSPVNVSNLFIRCH